ncbi:MAG TPA: DNA mismatch repair endonuclease MutL [Bdellovibrionales bacterium]|nr:DNA mismatch repair endonuclease MutL [Bdellovibrionales bacterium]
MTNTPRIQLLASEVVDQIAAGEVVERPAHLVKELVENAIDAGATSVEIEYDQGGRRVRVTDNGRGIAKEDLALALARHATSKITQADDLWNLSSFGFRGEALASIAAVSRLTLQSRTENSETAHKVVAEFGKLSAAEPSSGNPGTTVLIEDLFANIPARLKFLKSEAGENAQIKNTLKALALAHEGVEFRLRSKGKVESLWKTAQSFVDRAQSVTEHGKLYHARGEYQDFKAEVVFASPHDVMGNTRSILFFVQGRWIQDRSLQAAVIEAYRGLLMHGEYPIAVVRLTVPPAEVDVNIHPTKSQVKFRDSQSAFRAVNRTLRDALEKAPWLNGAKPAAQASVAEMPTKRMSVADLTRPYTAAVTEAVESFAAAPEFSVGRFEAPEFSTVMFKQKTDLGTENRTATDQPTPTGGAWSRLQILGQAHLTYIIAQDHDRLVLVDQHAAHERVAYERLMKAWLGGQAEVQPLLLPITIELEPDGAEALMSIAGELEKLGVGIDQNGPQSVALRSMPVLIKEAALAKALKGLASEIVDRGGGFALENKISDLCATMACHSVVRAGQALSFDQMKSLLSQMDEFALSSFCPHGRPVSVDYPFAKLERDFGRTV